MFLNAYRQKSLYIGRLGQGADLLRELIRFAREKGIRQGVIGFLGAVERARLAFYDQSRQAYETMEFDQPLEILSGTGNISQKDGEVFVHAHVVLGDHAGRAFGGHLVEGTVIFACEVWMIDAEGPALERVPDGGTGLTLWREP